MQLESIFEIYKTAVFEKDIERFISIFDDDVRVFDMWQEWQFNGIKAWRRMTEGSFAALGSNRDVVTFEEVKAIDNDGIAVITAIVKFTNVNEVGDELRFLQNRLTWIVRKQEGQWKIIHQHTSSPIDGKLQAILQR
jgi:uncharacterized protein (TIGR02246 family)